MKIDCKQYDSNYHDKITDLLKLTWDFSLHFKNLKDNDVLYSLYFDGILIKCSYGKIVVDEKDQVLGVIFAEMNKKSNKWKMFKLNTKIFIGAIKGEYGERKAAFSFFNQYIRECKILYKRANFDNEVSLLMVSPLSKGMGLGKKMINNYREECKKNKISKIGLQTGSDCDYHFYEHLGFIRESSMYSDMYEKGIEEDNFFIYTIDA